MEKLYNDDVNISELTAQMEILQVLLKDGDYFCFDNIIAKIRRIEIGPGKPTYPVTAQDYYRRIYFEAIELMMNAIDLRFDQPSFVTYAKMESLLIKLSIRRTNPKS